MFFFSFIFLFLSYRSYHISIKYKIATLKCVCLCESWLISLLSFLCEPHTIDSSIRKKKVHSPKSAWKHPNESKEEGKIRKEAIKNSKEKQINNVQIFKNRNKYKNEYSGCVPTQAANQLARYIKFGLDISYICKLCAFVRGVRHTLTHLLSFTVRIGDCTAILRMAFLFWSWSSFVNFGL